MKLSSNEEYGLRCLLRLAYAGHGLTIPELSQSEGVSSAYTAKSCAFSGKAVTSPPRAAKRAATPWHARLAKL